MFLVPGVNFLSIHFDTLHMFDLGISAHVYGNLLWSILEDDIKGNRDNSMAVLNADISKIYQAHGVPASSRFPHLNVSNINTSGSFYPFLKHIKGRKIRHFSPIAVDLAEQYKSKDKSSQHRYLLMKALDDLYNCIDAPVFVWPGDIQSKFKDASQRMLAHYSWLAKDAMIRNLCRYSITQKFHMSCCRFPVQNQFVSPRLCWNYGAESFMGVMSRLAAACVHGTQASKVSKPIIDKYRLAMTLVMTKQISLD